MAHHQVGEIVQDEDAAELTFPKEFENAETLLISEVKFFLTVNLANSKSKLNKVFMTRCTCCWNTGSSRMSRLRMSRSSLRCL